MPNEDYRQTIYDNLTDAYGKDQMPDYATFNKKLDTDPNYSGVLFSNLKDYYGADQLPDSNTFTSRLSGGKQVVQQPVAQTKYPVVQITQDVIQQGQPVKQPQTVLGKPVSDIEQEVITNAEKKINEITTQYGAEKSAQYVKDQAKKYQQTNVGASTLLYEKAIELNPTDPENFLQLSWNKLQSGDPQAALQNANAAEMVLQQQPLTERQRLDRVEKVDNPYIHQIKAVALQQLGDYQGSVEAGKKSIQIASSKPTGEYLYQQNENDLNDLAYTSNVVANSYAKLGDVENADKYNKQTKDFENYSKSIVMAKENEAYRRWFASGQFEKDFFYEFVRPEVEAAMGFYEGVKGIGKGIKEVTEGAIKGETPKQQTSKALKIFNSELSTAFSAMMFVQPVVNYGFSALGVLGESYAPESYSAVMQPISMIVQDSDNLTETQKELVTTGDTFWNIVMFHGLGKVKKSISEGYTVRARKEAQHTAELVQKGITGSKLSEQEIKELEKIVDETPDAIIDASAKLAEKVAEKKKEVDAKIAVAQKKGFYEKDVKTQISDEVFTTIDKLEKGEPITNEFIDKASTELYNEYKRLEKIKDADTRTNTIEQINEVQERIGRDIELLENTKLKQKETGKFATVKEEVKPEPHVETKVEPIEEAKPVTETPVEAGVKPVEIKSIEEPLNKKTDFDIDGDLTDAGFKKVETKLKSIIINISEKFNIPIKRLFEHYNLTKNGEYLSSQTPILKMGESIEFSRIVETFRKILFDKYPDRMDEMSSMVDKYANEILNALEGGRELKLDKNLSTIYSALREIDKEFTDYIKPEINKKEPAKNIPATTKAEPVEPPVETKPVEKAVEPVSEPVSEPVKDVTPTTEAVEGVNEGVNEGVSEGVNEGVKPFNQRTDTEHATYIKDQFRKQFSEKGVPQEQIDGAIALMEARAKASGKGDGWYRGIEDVKSGEFNEKTKKLFQLVGEKGLSKKKEIIKKLDNAKKLEKQGLNDTEIWQKTGWQRGVDGKWRYEIDDPFFIKDTKKIKIEIEDSGESQTFPLKDVYNTENLLPLYPELKDFKVEFISEDNAPAGELQENNKKIIINLKKNGNQGTTRQTVIHELQHFVAGREGFPRGSNAADTYRRLLEEYGRTHPDKPIGRADRYKLFRQAKSEYTRSAGEVEARNAQYRGTLPKDGRRRISPLETEDVAREEQIVLFDKIESQQQIVGENAIHKKEILDNLDVAKKMETSKESPEKIKQATGWHRGIDEKWKYETDDSTAKIKIDPLQERDSLIKGEKTKEYKLSEILDDKKLLESVPELKDTTVILTVEGDLEHGSGKINGENYIQINLNKNDAFEHSGFQKILRHELQHTAQSIFGFAKGDNADTIRERMVNEFREKNKRNPSGKEHVEIFNKADREYRLSAGELEARDVENRIQLTKEERKQNMPFKGQDISEAIIKLQRSGDVARGAVETLENGKKVIHALERPDFSTMVHEIAHIFEGDLTKAELKTVKDIGGSEKFARGFERYLRDGKAPTAELKTLFEKFKTWLTDIYKTLKGSEIENKVSPEVKKIFDRLLTEQEKAKPTEPTSKSVLKQYTDNQEQLYKDHVEKTLQDKGIEIGNDKELVTQEVLNEMSKNPDKPISENVEKGVDNYVEQFGEKPTTDALLGKKETTKPTVAETPTVETPQGMSVGRKARREQRKKIAKEQKDKEDGDNLAMSVSKQLPLTPKENPDFIDSPINNVLTLKQISRNIINGLGLREGGSVRKGLISRFKRNAAGLYFNKDGIIRVSSLNDLYVLAHEVGHHISLAILDIKNSIPKNQFSTLKKELIDMLKKDNYPEKNFEEGVAEYVRKYIIERDIATQDAPQFTAFFEKLLDGNDKFKNVIEGATDNYKLFKSQDPRAITMSTIERQTRKFMQGVRELSATKVIYNLFDNIQYVRDLNKLLLKEDATIGSEKQPLYSCLSLIGVDGKVKQWLENSPFSNKGKDIILKTDIKGFLKILKDFDRKLYPHLEAYLVSLRNIELHKNNKSGSATTSLEIAEKTKELYEKELGKDKLDNLVADIRKYEDALLDYYYESGKLSKEALDKIKEKNKYHIPFKRFIDEMDMTGSFNKVSNKLYESSPSPVKYLRESDENIISPFESIIKNTYDIIAAADRNTALKNVVDALKTIQESKIKRGDAGGLIQEVPKGKIVAARDLKTGETVYTYKTEAPKDKRIVSVWENGEQKFYEIDSELHKGMFAINEQISNAIRVLSLPSRWLQAGAVVFDPTFFARNIPRDQMSALFYSKYGYSPVDFIKGVASGIRIDEYYQKWLASGGDQSFMMALDKALSKNYMNNRVGDRLKSRYKVYAKNPLAAIQDLGRASEAGTRIGAFRNAMKKTNGDTWKSMEESRIIAADYGTIGAALKNIAPLYPFLNARMQHMKQTAISVKNHPVKTLTKGIAFVTVPAFINWISNNYNEEDRKRYMSLPAWRRLAFFNIHIPGTDSYLPLPKGFWGTLFGTSIESFMDYTSTQDDRVVKQLPKQLFKEISPISNTTELAPQFARPLIEQWANKKAFSGQPIVPESMKSLLPEEQFTENTPEILKKIGSFTGISPLRIEAIIGGYGGGAATGLVRINDEILQTIGVVDSKPDDTFTKLSRLPLLKAFVTETPTGTRSSYAQDFYDKLDNMEEINKTVDNYVVNYDTEKAEKYLSKGKNKQEYLYYLKNKKSIDIFKNILRYSYDIKFDIMSDKSLSDKDKKEKIDKINSLITQTAIDFSDAHKAGRDFNLSENINNLTTQRKERLKKEKSERGEFREDVLKEAGIEIETPPGGGTPNNPSGSGGGTPNKPHKNLNKNITKKLR